MKTLSPLALAILTTVAATAGNAAWQHRDNVAWAESAKFKNSGLVVLSVPRDGQCFVMLGNRVEVASSKQGDSYAAEVPVSLRVDDGLPYDIAAAWVAPEDRAQTVSWVAEPRLLADMAKGRTLRMQKSNGDIDRVELKGFASALTNVIRACNPDEDARYFK